MTKLISQKLIDDIEGIIAFGKKRAKEAMAQHLVWMYWTIGERIIQEGFSVGKSDQNEQSLRQIAQQIGLEYRQLCYCVKFYQQKPQLPDEENRLSWTHYRMLLSIDDNQKREWYEKKIYEEGLTKRQLQEEIKTDRYEFDQSVAQQQKEAKIGTVKRPTTTTYLYRAVVEDVIDGDTLILRLDLGFNTWRSQRVRLFGINSAEIDTFQGQKAREYVGWVLKEIPWVMLKSVGYDKYGRCVGHVFYAAEQSSKHLVYTEGVHLNQQIVTAGHAEIMI